MGANVFANGLEVSCEKATNKSPASMPDTCWSPPSPPVGPVPIPYPNFSFASDTTDGTTTVQIAGGQVGKKNKSCYKKSTGDEAATKTLGMGLTTGCIQGKQYFAAWSSDVKFEGENAVRFGDFTGSNHASPTACSANTTGSVGQPAPPVHDEECIELEKAAEKAVNEDITENGGGPGTALVTAKHSSGSTFKACRPPDAIRSDKSNGYSPKQSTQKQPGDTMACGGDNQMKYADNPQKGHNHAEATIIEDVVAMQPRGGSITMRVNWNVGGGHAVSHSPCDHCKSTICKTQQECGITIYICTGEDPPPPPMKKKKAPCKTVKHGKKKAKKVGRSSSHVSKAGWGP